MTLETYIDENGATKMTAKFYHDLELRHGCHGGTVRKIVDSDAQTIDAAYAERCKLQKQYHVNELVSISIRQIGVPIQGPHAC